MDSTAKKNKYATCCANEYGDCGPYIWYREPIDELFEITDLTNETKPHLVKLKLKHTYDTCMLSGKRGFGVTGWYFCQECFFLPKMSKLELNYLFILQCMFNKFRIMSGSRDLMSGWISLFLQEKAFLAFLLT